MARPWSARMRSARVVGDVLAVAAAARAPRPARPAAGTGRSRRPTRRPGGSPPCGRGPCRCRCSAPAARASEPSRLQLVLHEHEVPELEEALGVVAGPVVVGAEVGAAVEVELASTARRARSGPTARSCPRGRAHDPLVRHADRAPALDRLLVGPEAELLVAAEDGDPDVARGRSPKPFVRQLERELHGALLEVVADREVAEHLEEGEVAVRSCPRSRCRWCGSTSGRRSAAATAAPPRRGSRA